MLSGPRVSSTSWASASGGRTWKPDRATGWVKRGQRAGGAADGLGPALERRLGLLVRVEEVEDQERRLAVTRLLGLEDLPAGGGRLLTELHGQD